MKKDILKIFLVLSTVFIVSCEKDPTSSDETQTRTVTFINKTYKDITIKDNSGRGMFEDVSVVGYATKKLTYECPSAGSCDIDFIYQWTGIFSSVCICTEGFISGTKYTFGFCPDNSSVEADVRCTSCSNSACD